MKFNFFFCSKRMKTIQKIKITMMFWCYSSQKCKQFFYCKIMPTSFCSFGIINIIICFSQFELISEIKAGHIYFSQTFSNHQFLMDNLFLTNYGLIFEILSGLHLISSYFKATVVVYQKNL